LARLKYIVNLLIFRFTISWSVYLDEESFIRKIHFHFQQKGDNNLSGKEFSGNIKEFKKTITNIDYRGCSASRKYVANVTLNFNGSNPVIVSLKISQMFNLVVCFVVPLFTFTLDNSGFALYLKGFLAMYILMTLLFYYEVITKWSGIHDMLLSGNNRVERIKIKENNR